MQTFLQAWRARNRFRGEVTEKQWFYGIAHRVAIDVIRRARKHPITTSEEGEQFEWEMVPLDEPTDPLALLLQVERRAAVRAAIRSLDPEQRQLVQLYYFEEKRFAEISAELGIPYNALRHRMRRIRQLIQCDLKRQQCRDAWG